MSLATIWVNAERGQHRASPQHPNWRKRNGSSLDVMFLAGTTEMGA